MAYSKTNWQNLPSTTTPVVADNLNKIENQLESNTNDVDALKQGIKGELLNISATTDSTGIISNISITQNFSNTPYVLSNFANILGTQYGVYMNGFNSDTKKISIRVRNLQTGEAITNTAISGKIYIVGI